MYLQTTNPIGLFHILGVIIDYLGDLSDVIMRPFDVCQHSLEQLAKWVSEGVMCVLAHLDRLILKGWIPFQACGI